MYAIPTTEEFVKARTYLDELVENGFGDWKAMGYYSWYNSYGHILKSKGWELYEGCTKAVMVFDDLNWVIKCDLDSYNNYCEKEVINWRKAIDEGFADYFAAAYFLDNKNGINFYIQEYAASDEDYYSSKCYDYYHSNSDPIEEGEEDWWRPDDEDTIYALIGGPKDYELASFCYNMHINDLHCGNFGQTKDGRTVIFDYSGF